MKKVPKLTTVDLAFIRDCLRKTVPGRAQADRLWAVIEKIELILEEEKHGRRSAE